MSYVFLQFKNVMMMTQGLVDGPGSHGIALFKNYLWKSSIDSFLGSNYMAILVANCHIFTKTISIHHNQHILTYTWYMHPETCVHANVYSNNDMEC